MIRAQAMVCALVLFSGCGGRSTPGCDGDYTVVRSTTSGRCLNLADVQTVSPTNCGDTIEQAESPFENGCTVRVTREGIADETTWAGTESIVLSCPGLPPCEVRREIEARR